MWRQGEMGGGPVMAYLQNEISNINVCKICKKLNICHPAMWVWVWGRN